jgi:hypothetical protein
MLESEPSVADYIRWLSAKVTDIPEVFAGVNENFIFVAVGGAPMIVGGSIDLAALQASAADSRGGYPACGVRCAKSRTCGVEKMVVLLWLQFCVGHHSS